MTATLLERPSIAEARRTRNRGVDIVIALALVAVSFGLRRHVPTDGLFYDDAWQAFGASKGSLVHFATAGQSQPGFTFLLMVWNRAFGFSTATILTPTLLIGSLGPGVLYVVLRSFRFARSVAALLGTMLAVTTFDIVYSARVKSYTGDALIVVALLAVVPRLAQRRWDRRTTVAWSVAAVLIATFSTFGLIATAVAGLTLLLHSNGDRKLRLYAVGAQALAAIVSLAVTSRTYNNQLIVDWFRPYGGYISLDANPARFARQVAHHFARLAFVFPGVHGWRAYGCMVAVVAALAIAAWRGPYRIAARYLALLLGTAFLGGLVQRVPFGPNTIANAGRVSLWLVPTIAFGLALILQAGRRALTLRLRAVFDVLACVAIVVLLASAVGKPFRYPPGGVQHVSREAVAMLGPHDTIWVTRFAMYSFALYSGLPVSLDPKPARGVGFLPHFRDPRVHLLDVKLPEPELSDSIKNARHVYVVHTSIGGGWYQKVFLALDVSLLLSGFKRTSSTTFGRSLVDVWEPSHAQVQVSRSSVARDGGMKAQP